MANFVTWRGSRADLARLLNSIPAVLSGQAPDPLQLARGLQLRISVAALSRIQLDFLTLSTGGISTDGRRWPPLADSTVRRRLAKETRANKGRKGKGKKNPYAGQIAILRDTGRLFRSLTPGIEGLGDSNPPVPGQVVKLSRGQVIVGTNVPYAKFHQEGTPKMRARPPLPVGGVLPEAYWPAVNAAALRGVVRAIEISVERGGQS